MHCTLLTVFDCQGISAARRERTGAAVEAAGQRILREGIWKHLIAAARLSLVSSENLIPICVARGVLMLCHVLHDHRATCDHYG